MWAILEECLRVCIYFIQQWLLENAEKSMGLHFCPGTGDGMIPKLNTGG